MDVCKTILIIEDHDIIVWALKLLIQDHYPGTTLHAVPTFEQGLEKLEQTDINLIILDVDVPGGNNTDMIHKLRNIKPSIQILVHSAIDEDTHALEYLTEGANGFISKRSSFADVMPEALKTVLAGRKYLSPNTQEAIVEQYLSQPIKNKKPPVELSPREQEIILLLLKGKWTKEIASQVGLGMTTVSTHKQRIFEKLEVRNIVELYVKIQKEMPELLTQSSAEA